MTDQPTPAPDPSDQPNDGPTLDEAKAAAANTPHVPQPDAAGLPDDVKDTPHGDTSPEGA